MRLFILGATGGTGVQLTKQALQRGNAVTAFVRSPEKIKIQHERLRIVKGDPKNVEQLERALREQDAVLSALGSTSRQANGILEAAARSTIEAMSRAKVRRLVVVSMALLFPDVWPARPRPTSFSTSPYPRV